MSASWIEKIEGVLPDGQVIPGDVVCYAAYNRKINSPSPFVVWNINGWNSSTAFRGENLVPVIELTGFGKRLETARKACDAVIEALGKLPRCSVEVVDNGASGYDDRNKASVTWTMSVTFRGR